MSATLPFRLENFPDELRKLKQWVSWRLEDSDTRERCKMPRTVKGFGASSTNPDHWSTLDETLLHVPSPIEKYAGEPYSAGVGCVCANGYVGVDLDHCWDDAKMQLDQFATDFLAKLPPTYTELTPSRSGLHLWYKLPDGHRPEKAGLRTKKAEVYFRDRYLTVTGWRAGNCPTIIHQLTVEQVTLLASAVEATREKKTATEGTPAIRSDKHQEYMTRFDFPDLSAVVHALVVILLRKHLLDAAKVDAEFRESAIFKNTHWKEKWERLGKQEIERCLDLARQWIERDEKRQKRESNGITAPDGFGLTDLGNAERFATEHGEDLMYVPGMKSYFAWSSGHWDGEFSQSIAHQRAKQTVRGLKDQAIDCSDHDQAKAVAKWAWESEGRSRFDNMVNLARSEVRQMKLKQFDDKPVLFNCANGTYHLDVDDDAAAFTAHDRNDLCSKITDIEFDKNAECPIWEAFVERVLPNEKLRKFVQRSLGYTLTGHDWQNYIWFLVGESGANGKSTFIETVRYVFGDYARAMEFASLLPKDTRGPTGDLARLQGARFVSAVESEQGQRLSARMIKQLTGGDTIMASFKFKDEFDFKPTHKLWLATNFAPVLPSNDDGLWRRVVRVPFDVQIPEGERDPELKEKLKAEGPGILNWMISGWRSYKVTGLKLSDVPELVEAKAKYRDEMDVVKDFIEAQCHEAPELEVRSTVLYLEFKRWFEQTHGRGARAMSQKLFGAQLRKRGFGQAHSRVGDCWRGLSCQSAEKQGDVPF